MNPLQFFRKKIAVLVLILLPFTLPACSASWAGGSPIPLCPAKNRTEHPYQGSGLGPLVPGCGAEKDSPWGSNSNRLKAGSISRICVCVSVGKSQRPSLPVLGRTVDHRFPPGISALVEDRRKVGLAELAEQNPGHPKMGNPEFIRPGEAGGGGAIQIPSAHRNFRGLPAGSNYPVYLFGAQKSREIPVPRRGPLGERCRVRWRSTPAPNPCSGPETFHFPGPIGSPTGSGWRGFRAPCGLRGRRRPWR